MVEPFCVCQRLLPSVVPGSGVETAGEGEGLVASRGGFLHWEGLQVLLHCLCDERLILVNPGKGTT